MGEKGVEVGVEGVVWSESVINGAANVVEDRSRCFCNGEHKGAKKEQF